MSAVKWAFAVGALLIGAALAGVFAQMASQVFVTGNFTMSGQPATEAEVVTTQPAEPVQTASVEKPAESFAPEVAQQPAPAEPVPLEPVPVEHTQGEIVDLDLVSYWKFDGGESGLDDYGRAGIRSVVTGNQVYTQGKIGEAFDFDGRSYILVADESQLNSPSFSVTFWVNPYQLRIQGIMDKISREGWTSGWRIFMNSPSGNIEFDASGEVANLSTPPIASDKWSFVAVTYDSGTQTARIYLDGVLSSQASGVDMQNSIPNNLIMGSLEDQRLDGRLDDVRFYNVALGDFQISEIYESVT